MKPETRNYIEQLRARYSGFGERFRAELEILNGFEKDGQSALMLAGYRDHPITESLVRSARFRFEESASRLLTERNMSQDERTACFLAMDWARWYIDIASKNPDEVYEQLDRQVLEIAKRAGVINT